MGPKKKGKQVTFEDSDEEALEAKRRAEEERLRLEKIRLEMERELKQMRKLKRKESTIEQNEHYIRTKVLQRNCKFFNDFKKSRENKAVYERKNKEWEDYSSCEIQPFPYDPPSLNTYIYAFHELEENGYFENVDTECEKLIEVLERVDEYINVPMYIEKRTVKNLEEVKERFCKEILYKYDSATFQGVMNIEKYFSKVNVWKVEALKRSKNFLLWIWGWAVGSNVERKKKNVFKDSFPKRSTEFFDIRLPRNLKYQRLHLRIIRITYDICSWKSPSIYLPMNPDAHDLYQETLNIREREINILKLHSGGLDHQEMPWWYLQVYPAPVKIKEEKPKPPIKPPNVKEEIVEEEESEDEEIPFDPTIWDNNTDVFKFDDHYLNLEMEEKQQEEIVFTPIIYSPEMLRVMRTSEKKCKGVVYYDEPDLIDFLQTDFRNLENSTSSSEDQELKHEDRSTFRTSLYVGNPNFVQVDNVAYLRAIDTALHTEHNDEVQIYKTNKREFLDWKSWESVDNSAEKLESILYDVLYERRKIKKDTQGSEVKDESKKEKKLRTVRDLLEATVLPIPEKTPVEDYVEEPPVQVKRTKRSTKAQAQPLDVSKVTTPDEMRAFDAEIKTLRERVNAMHSEWYRNVLTINMDPDCVNLREYSVIGGVYLIDFIHDEPQPAFDESNNRMQLHYGEYSIKKRPFLAVPLIHFDATLVAERQLSAARSSMYTSVRQKQKSLGKEKEVELEDDETIHIKLKVYEKAIWFANPIPILWDEEKKCWIHKHVYSPEFKSDEGKVFFKLGLTSVPLALAADRWINLPYIRFLLSPNSNWEEKPSVQFALSAKLITLEFTIDEEFITLSSTERVDSNPIKHIIGVPFRMYDLVNEMRKSNIDVFPDWDTFLYSKSAGSPCVKCRPLEEYLYYCFAFISSAYDIQDSSWNHLASEDQIYFCLKESIGDPEEELRTAVSTPWKTYFVANSGGLMEIPVEPLMPDFAFVPDLKTLVENTASGWAMERISSAPSGLVWNVYSMLLATKILSFT